MCLPEAKEEEEGATVAFEPRGKLNVHVLAYKGSHSTRVCVSQWKFLKIWVPSRGERSLAQVLWRRRLFLNQVFLDGERFLRFSCEF